MSLQWTPVEKLNDKDVLKTIERKPLIVKTSENYILGLSLEYIFFGEFFNKESKTKMYGFYEEITEIDDYDFDCIPVENITHFMRFIDLEDHLRLI